jgi:ABC-type Fe3+-hydroxamate transport system substrate-binding protein
MSARFTDMLGNEISVSYPPKRIISLVPSQTELLYDLGLDEEVVGITKFCVHPNEWFRNKRRVGGTKTIHIDIIKELQPDLIIANKEENTKDQIEELASMFPLWTSNIQTVDEGLQMIRSIGDLVGRGDRAKALASEIEAGFAGLTKSSAPRRVAYFIWRNPWMCAGGDTFISDMIQRMGWVNVLADKMRYPEIDLQELVAKNVDLILLSSEPYPFKAPHIAEIKAVLPSADVMLVDGEMFSWYGSRMLHAIPYVSSLLQGSVF